MFGHLKNIIKVRGVWLSHAVNYLKLLNNIRFFQNNDLIDYFSYQNVFLL